MKQSWAGTIARTSLASLLLATMGCDALTVNSFAGTTMQFTLQNAATTAPNTHLELWARTANGDIVRISPYYQENKGLIARLHHQAGDHARRSLHHRRQGQSAHHLRRLSDVGDQGRHHADPGGPGAVHRQSHHPAQPAGARRRFWRCSPFSTGRSTRSFPRRHARPSGRRFATGVETYATSLLHRRTRRR